MASSCPPVTYSQLIKCRDGLKEDFRCKLCKKLPEKLEMLISFSKCPDIFCNQCIATDFVDVCPICKQGSLDADISSHQQLSKTFQFMLNISIMEEDRLAKRNVNRSKQLQNNVNSTDMDASKNKNKIPVGLSTTNKPPRPKPVESVKVPPVQSTSNDIAKQPAADGSVPFKLLPTLTIKPPKHTALNTNRLANASKSVAPSRRSSLDTPGTSGVHPVSAKLSRPEKQAKTTTAKETIKSKKVSHTDPEDVLKTAKGESNIHVSSNKESETQIEMPKRLKTAVATPKSTNRKPKRNVQGETPLIISCRIGDMAVVNDLLLNGDDVNAQDHAKWTALHEAANHGFVDIVEKLLDYGALINLPGGTESVTPLHDAVVNNKLEVVKLLVQRGADTTIRNSYGYIPSDVAQTEEMKEALRAKIVLDPAAVNKPVVPTVPPRVTCHKPVVVLSSNLATSPLKLLKKLVKNYKWKLAPDYSPDVTHIVTPTVNDLCAPSYNILCGILQGKWILDEEWLKMCDQDKDSALTNPQSFEVKGTTNFGHTRCMKAARLNSAFKLPGLFHGCHIFVKAIFGTGYTVDKLELSKEEIRHLIQYGEGTIISREPDPESIPQQQCTVPYHSKVGGSLGSCSHYILYSSGKHEPKLKFNMPHIKTLPLEWLIKCIQRFELGDP